MKQLTTEKEPPSWEYKYFEKDLSPFLYAPTSIEFAEDEKDCILIWSPSKDSKLSDFDKEYGEYVILNIDGNVLDNGDKNKRLCQKYEASFPDIFARQTFHKFVQPFDCWRFFEDLNFCVAASSDPFKPSISNIQLFDMKLKRRLWKIELEPVFGSAETINPIKWNNKDCILFGFSGEYAYILSKDGDILKKFFYGPPNTEETRKEYQRKFNIFCFDGGCSLNFFAHKIAYDPIKRWIACGDNNSRRVRIVSIDPPYNLLLELNTDDHPSRPSGGRWNVFGLTFAGEGSYLIIEYVFMGRGTSKVFYPTEIYETKSWHKIWSENKINIRSVSISPDGGKIAFFRDKVIEVGKFDGMPGVGAKAPIKTGK